MKKLIVYLDDSTPDDYLNFLAVCILKDRFVRDVEVVSDEH